MNESECHLESVYGERKDGDVDGGGGEFKERLRDIENSKAIEIKNERHCQRRRRMKWNCSARGGGDKCLCVEYVRNRLDRSLIQSVYDYGLRLAFHSVISFSRRGV